MQSLRLPDSPMRGVFKRVFRQDSPSHWYAELSTPDSPIRRVVTPRLPVSVIRGVDNALHVNTADSVGCLIHPACTQYRLCWWIHPVCPCPHCRRWKGILLIQLFNVELFNVKSFYVCSFKVESCNLESFNAESFNMGDAYKIKFQISNI